MAVRHNRLDTLRAGNYDGSSAEWESVLRKTLLGESIQDAHAQNLENLECVATVSKGEELKIIWRRNTGGIIVSIHC